MPSQFNGQVFEDNGRPISRLQIEIDYPGRVGDRIFTLTDRDGKWEITLDDNPNPNDITVRFYGDGYETKIVTNPQPTEVLNGFIDPEKGGTLNLTGKYKDGKYEFKDFNNETQSLIYKEIKDIWKFVSRNYGNYILTIDATETRNEKTEDTSIELQLPGLLAEARRDELKKILDDQFYQYLLDARSKSGDREGFALIQSNTDVPHQPKVELGNIDVVEGIKPGAKIKLSFIEPPKTNIPIPNNEIEFFQLLIDNGFTKANTQEDLDYAFGEGAGDISKVEFVYFNKNEDTFTLKLKPDSKNLRPLIAFRRRGITVILNQNVTTNPIYSFTFDITHPEYQNLKPNIQKSISDYIINLQKKSNLQSLDKESLIKKIENISSTSINANPAYKETLQKIINTDIKSAKGFIEKSPLEDQPRLYNLLNKQKDIILINGFSVDITW
jgi:hypothetical protein